MSSSNLVDVVDEDDRVTQTVSVQNAREQGLIHRIARIMVEDEKSRKILLQKRTAKLLWPNCWDNSAAGHVDAGEDYLTAAKRELFEEIGVKSEHLEQQGKYFTDQVYNGYRLRRFNMLYKCRVNSLPTNLQAEEVSEVRWFTLEEIKQLIHDYPEKTTDGLKDVIGRFY